MTDPETCTSTGRLEIKFFHRSFRSAGRAGEKTLFRSEVVFSFRKVFSFRSFFVQIQDLREKTFHRSEIVFSFRNSFFVQNVFLLQPEPGFPARTQSSSWPCRDLILVKILHFARFLKGLAPKGVPKSVPRRPACGRPAPALDLTGNVFIVQESFLRSEVFSFRSEISEKNLSTVQKQFFVQNPFLNE